MPALQIIYNSEDGKTYIKGSSNPDSVAVKMECTDMEGKRPKVIGNCLYNDVCLTGHVGQGIETCLRWRRKPKKPNQDTRQIALFR